MKNITAYERVLGWFSPQAAMRRIAWRRAYEAASNYAYSDWDRASATSANTEVGAGQSELQRKSRDLARNSPWAIKALNTIVSNTVGSGIIANIKGRNKTQEKRLKQLWTEVAETNKCDAYGLHNFYGLQALAMRSIVEGGEIIAPKLIEKDAPKLKILESEFINQDLNTRPYIRGVKVVDDKPAAYVIFKQHPGDRDAFATTADYVEIPADRILHAFKQERPGQIRGVPWSYGVIETLKDLADYQYSTLVARKISACLVGVITTDGNQSALPGSDLKAKREAELQMNPGTMRYLGPGEDVKFSSPPTINGYAEFVRESMRAVAAGYGVSYEALTGDYSQVNFSSGRMGAHEFRRNIDSWRWNILIPMFCEPFFQLFLEWAKIQGVDINDAYCEWVPPAYIMIDPTKEITASKEAVLAGFTSRSQVIREQGYDPDSVREEIRLEREADSVAGLKFDTDAGHTLASKGMNVPEEQDSKEKSTHKPTSSDDKPEPESE